MKNLNLRRLALTALFVLSLSSAFASGNIRINPYLNTDYSIVSIINTSESNQKLKVYDENGNIYYSQTVEAETNSQKLFDLSNLEDGNYSLVLVGENSRIERTFQIAARKLVVSDNSMQLAENKTKSSKNYAFKK